jgi:hypothetical protein
LKSKLILVVLLLVLASFTLAPLYAKDPPQNLQIEIQRTAVAGQYGLVHLTDQFMIRNNGTSSVSTIDFGFDRKYRNTIYYMDAKDQQGNQLTLDPDVNQTSFFFWVRTHFAHDLEPKKTYNFTVSSVLSGVMQPVLEGIQYNFTAAPVLTQDAKLANSTFIAVAGSSFVTLPNSTYRTVTLGGYPATTNVYKPWKAYSRETFYAPFRSVNQYFLDLDWAERDISIGVAGRLRMTDKYHFHNPSVVMSSLTISLPSGASNVMAYDEVGALWASAQNPNPPYEVTISPRYSQGLRGRENFTLTLTYNLPQSTYVKQLGGWGNYNLTLTLLNNRQDLLLQRATVKIIAPSGLRVTGWRTPPQSPVSYPIQVDENDRTLTLQGITNQNNVTFSMTFSYIPFWSAFEILPWVVGFELVMVAFALVFQRRRPVLEVPVPVERLREFVGLYDERLALSKELVVMDEDVARGSLVKHEFRRRKKVLDQRLDEVNRSLMQLKTELRTISIHYDELIRSIDRAEAEVEASRASLNQVRGQYRAGRTTREAYDSLVNDITRRIDRAEERVETALITLREEAR